MEQKRIDDPQLYRNYDRAVTARWENQLKGLEIAVQVPASAMGTLEKRYLIKDKKGVPTEDVKSMFTRVAANIAYPEMHYGATEEEAYKVAEEFFKAMAECKFMPNSPALMNAGRYTRIEGKNRYSQQTAACFVLYVGDSIEEIYQGVKEAAIVHKSGGGTGFDFSHVRRKNGYVSSTNSRATGPLSFIKVFNEGTEAINQGGFRRGANMGMLRAEHPDLLQFIHSKDKPKAFENFNFSVALTDEFMRAVETDQHYVVMNDVYKKEALTVSDLLLDLDGVNQKLITANELNLLLADSSGKVLTAEEAKKFESEGTLEARLASYNQIFCPHSNKIVGKVQDGKIMFHAKTIFREIAEAAWKRGDPGVVFIDRINAYNPTPHVGIIESTNPCGEQPLLPYEACNLTSINLEKFVKDKDLDWDSLRKYVHLATRFLDDMIDMSEYPLDKIIQQVRANRKIGLGVMGLAGVLEKLGMGYNTHEARDFAKKTLGFVNEESKNASEELAKTRGVFPNWTGSIYDPASPYASRWKGRQLRNATTTTIAPTGTISIIANTTGGIECRYAIVFKQEATGETYVQEEVLEELNNRVKDKSKLEQILAIVKDTGSIQNVEGVPDDLQKIYLGAHDLSIPDHVLMQATIQSETDNAVSKTVNVTHDKTVDDVLYVYSLSYKEGCKGVTVFRDGCRERQILTTGHTASNLEKGVASGSAGQHHPKKRPDSLPGHTLRKKTGCGNLFITLNNDVDEKGESSRELFETFARLGKGGGCASAQTEAVGRLLSMLLRSDADPLEVASQLIGIRCHRPCGFGENAIYSCPDAMGKAIAEKYGVEPKDEENIGDSENFEDLLSPQKEKPKEKKAIVAHDDSIIGGGACPECGSTMMPAEGCHGGRCSNKSCSYSECNG